MTTLITLAPWLLTLSFAAVLAGLALGVRR